MTLNDFELVEMLLEISEKPSITKEYKVVFLKLLETLIENILTSKSSDFRKSNVLVTLLSWQMKVSDSKEKKDIKKFKEILIECYEGIATSILSNQNSSDFIQKIESLVKNLSVLQKYDKTAIDSIKTKIFTDIVEQQTLVLTDIEKLFLTEAGSSGSAEPQSSELKLQFNNLSIVSDRNEQFLKNIFYEQGVSIDQANIIIALRTRRVTQKLLLEDSSGPFLDFLESDDSRNSEGECQALKVASTYIEMALDRMSNGQRDTKRIGSYIRQHEHKSLYTHAYRTLPHDSFVDNAVPMLRAMKLNVHRIPNLKATDKELRRVCAQSIEHSIIKRRFSFKSRPKHFNFTDAAQSMRDLRDTFDKAGVDFFLMSGTLLGAIREKGFIASDYDIDIGIFENQADIPLLYEICENSLLFSIDEIIDNAIVKVKHITGIVIDLFIYFEVDGLQCHRGAVHEWYNSNFELTEIDFLGGKYYIPDNHEHWLTENYGNWEKPVIFYDMSYDTPNRDYVSDSTRGIYYLQERITKSLRKNWNNFIFMGMHALRDEFQLDFTPHLLPAHRRKSKIEAPEKKFKSEQIVNILVGYFDGVSIEQLTSIQKAQTQDGICLAAVCDVEKRKNDKYLLVEHSFAERCKTAMAIKCVDGVISAKTFTDMQKIKSKYKNANLIYMDDVFNTIEKTEAGT